MYVTLISKILKYKIPDITNLATITTLNAEINVIKNKIPNISNIATTTALTAEYLTIVIISLLQNLLS